VNNKTLIALGLFAVALYLNFVQSGKNIASQIGIEFMKISDSGLRLIANFEGFSAYPYIDAKGQSVGFGHFILPTDKFTFPMTEETAYTLLGQDAAKANDAVSRFVKVPLTQNQHDALVSLVYNIGEGNFYGSTLLRLLNAGDYMGAAAQFPNWRKSQGQIVQALVDRRQQEQNLFLEA
jgi:lysozyme